MSSSLLADWACDFRLDHAGEAADKKTRELLYDFLGTLIGGFAREESARVAAAWAVGQYPHNGAKGARLLTPEGPRLPSELTAFAHGVAGHSLEMDDVHNASSLHPAVVVIPPALAVAEEFDRSFRELLEAIIVGYEIALRVGEAAGPAALYSRGFHPTAVCGVFAAAAAAGKLMKLDRERMIHALGLAWGFSSGNMSFQTQGSWAKRMQVGHACQAGVQAARLAALGATGPAGALDPSGFFAAYAGGCDRNAMRRELGEKVKIGETSIKPYACCRYNQGPVDLALKARETDNLKPDAALSITVNIPKAGMPLVAEPIERKREPRDPVEAQFSLPYSVAVALVAGAAGPDQYAEPWLSDPRVRALARRVTCEPDPRVEALYPARWATRMTVMTKGGFELRESAEFCLGDPQAPLRAEGLRGKFDAITAGALAGGSGEAIMAALQEFESEKATALLDLLTGRFDR